MQMALHEKRDIETRKLYNNGSNRAERGYNE